MIEEVECEMVVVKAEVKVRVKTWRRTTSGEKRLVLQSHAHIRVSRGVVGCGQRNEGWSMKNNKIAAGQVKVEREGGGRR